MTNTGLIDQITLITEKNITDVLEFKEFTKAELYNKVNDKTWSAMECIEHLNRYSEFYIPEIAKQVGKGKRVLTTEEFKPGVIGGYFAKVMKPNDKAYKMKTFKSKNPSGSKLDDAVLEKFIMDQRQFLKILEEVKTTDLKRVKTATTLGPLVRFRMGDTLLFYTNHNWRHVEQAKRMLY